MGITFCYYLWSSRLGYVSESYDLVRSNWVIHSSDEKARGLEKSAFGVVGLETAFPILYTYLVHTGLLTPEALVNKLVWNPRKRFAIPMGNDFSVWDLDAQYTIDPADFLSQGKATPFAGWNVHGKCMATFHDGQAVYLA